MRESPARGHGAFCGSMSNLVTDGRGTIVTKPIVNKTRTKSSGSFIVSQGQASGKVTLVDASGLAQWSSGVDLRASREAALQMDDAPTQSSASPTATNLVSLYQTNSVALRAEMSFAVAVIRPNSVATMTGVTWGAGTDSPMLSL